MLGVDVKEAVVFVTGANRGIGRAIAVEAVARGAKKVYAAAPDVQVLINNAGVAGYCGVIYDHDPETAQREMATNYFGPQGVSVFGIYPGPIDTDMAAGVPFDKESPQNVAIRIFDDMSSGVEDITTDAFADDFVQRVRADAKAVEAETAAMAHQPAD